MTPLMQQYQSVKEQYPDALILFQVGDFFELFYEDAIAAAAYLGITLTSRGFSKGDPIPLCGVPCHTVDHYLIKLVQAGFRVVMCEQKGEAVTGKLVDRVVRRVFSPGTITDDTLLPGTSSAILAVMTVRDQSCALIFLELISGKQQGILVPLAQKQIIEAELWRMQISELVVSQELHSDHPAATYVRTHNTMVTVVADMPLQEVAYQEVAYTVWCNAVLSEVIQGLCMYSGALRDATLLVYRYLAHYAGDTLAYMRPLHLYQPTDFLILDAMAQRNLEIVRSLRDGSSKGTLYAVLNHAVTAMGARKIRDWLVQPLYERDAIERRLAYVECIVRHTTCREQIRELLRKIGDFERIAGRIIVQRGTVADYRMLARTITYVQDLCQCLAVTDLHTLMYTIERQMESYQALKQILGDALACDEGAYIISTGYHTELDRLRMLRHTGERAIALHETQERIETGIASLKIIFHQSYGYLYELSKTHRAAIPARYTVVQSLVQKERYTAPQLQQLAYDISCAQRQSEELEQELFAELVAQTTRYHHLLRLAADTLSELDGYMGFASAAMAHGYVRPCFIGEDEPRHIQILQGRHPVVEQSIREQGNSTFIANDFSAHETERIWIITGPNMGGKSTFLRQVALMMIMAQAGSFVPATSARLPLCDRIFTRIGAADNVAAGKSTFFVEMEEVAVICTEATARSFVILDELGRGTSTHDGRALAQSVLEFLLRTVGCYGLFATHYHDLIGQLDTTLPIGLYQVATEVYDNELVLLHTLVPGVATGSFGIAIAERVGLPPVVITRARALVSRDSVHT